MRHIGKITNTGSRCVVVFMQIPNKEDCALVVSTDNLPDRIESALMNVVESPEGQGDPVLANVLSRRLMPDMGNVSILQILHDSGLLLRVPVDNVVMLPQPNMPFPLRDVLEKMGKTIPDTLQSSPEINNAEQVKYNPYDTAAIEVTEDSRAKAKLKILEAQLLEDEAAKKREEAYRYDPSLRPVPVAPKAEEAETTTIAVKKAPKAKAEKA